MLNALILLTKEVLNSHHIAQKDINYFNTQLLKNIDNTQQIHQFLENYIVFISEKYNIDFLKTYKIHKELWIHIIHFKFEHPNKIIELKMIHKKAN